MYSTNELLLRLRKAGQAANTNYSDGNCLIFRQLMSSSLTLQRHFLWLILLAYYSISYCKESFSKKKIKDRNMEHDTVQSNSLEQSPNPVCGTDA